MSNAGIFRASGAARDPTFHQEPLKFDRDGFTESRVMSMMSIHASGSVPGAQSSGNKTNQNKLGNVQPGISDRRWQIVLAWLNRNIACVLRVLLIIPLRAYFRYVPFPLGKHFLWENVAERLWWLETTVDVVDVFGIRRRVNARDIIGRYIYYFGIWEPNLTHWIRERLAPGDVFIDVGANVGYYSLLASHLVGPEGMVVAIEPLSESFTLLQHNLERNHAANSRAINIAAWNAYETVTIFSRESNPGVSSIMPFWAKHWNLKGQRMVSARPLSDILDPIEIRTARLIKIDVEGAEWRVICGMESMFNVCRPDLELMIELSPPMLRAQGRTSRDVFDLFERWGFHAYWMENSYSATSYYSAQPINRPIRISRVPDRLFQADIIFSRTNASSL
jgi:FkbM family methyltransferase